MDTASIILGWLLGILSPVIVSRINRQYKKKDLHTGIIKEINHIKVRLIFALDIVSKRTGSYDQDLVAWLLERYESIEDNDPLIIKTYRMQIKAPPSEFEALKQQLSPPPDTGLTLQKVQLLFTNMHLMDFSLFSVPLQSEIFELKSRIEILNTQISIAEKYFFMTFDSNINSVNLPVIKHDLTNKYVQLETAFKRAIVQIDTVNNIEKI